MNPTDPTIMTIYLDMLKDKTDQDIGVFCPYTPLSNSVEEYFFLVSLGMLVFLGMILYKKVFKEVK